MMTPSTPPRRHRTIVHVLNQGSVSFGGIGGGHGTRDVVRHGPSASA
eukprot:CAMPEP_0172557472 /NCGR_PEP_ID=MMETSP1067-20121228/73422_1 /TAXON_ID=265564 ORGANISM="Thalassiosira punctigera, Strain Tpunct2005C2" /NCGR_SAMPLE_ID=MMETSP1067 /ASSEMBLY_ACC=CAM_ASM_000444 /LENGTH=46 /DNA_ID= /DNA_START= /DNA_END= /DNA_ORIENTATION=